MRAIAMVLVGILAISLAERMSVSAADYSVFSTETIGWGLGLNEEHLTPTGSYPYAGYSLEEHQALYVGDTEQKVVYLTFDCGYEYGNTPKILDTLKANDIHAIFFVTEPFLQKNPDLIKRMKEEGHLVGNHTCTHTPLSSLTPEQITDELTTIESEMKELTGYELDKFVRPPEGKYSEQVLEVLNDLGYTTVFWSLAWYDYNVDDQPSASSVVDKFVKYYHPGMVPLIHVVSTANTEALPQIISYMKGLGYSFKRIDTAIKKAPSVNVTCSNRLFINGKLGITVESESDGKQTVEFFDSKMRHIKAPKKAGTYFVRVKIDSTDEYKAAQRDAVMYLDSVM